MIVVVEKNLLSYTEALARQKQLTDEGTVGWLLFSCSPIVTLGKRAEEKDVLTQTIPRLRVTRGGLVTYHGPEQILGFPLGSLEAHTGDSRAARGFVENLVDNLSRFISSFPSLEIDSQKSKDCTGVWIYRNEKISKKIVSIGLKFNRTSIEHGFALNVDPLDVEYVVNPCGETADILTSLYLERDCSAEKFSLMQALGQALIHQVIGEIYP